MRIPDPNTLRMCSFTSFPPTPTTPRVLFSAAIIPAICVPCPTRSSKGSIRGPDDVALSKKFNGVLVMRLVQLSARPQRSGWLMLRPVSIMHTFWGLLGFDWTKSACGIHAIVVIWSDTQADPHWLASCFTYHCQYRL